ncbi:MAG: transposase family protein [Actinobacteria bacterium]|nr:transposase family protein [Actinomycetota bacterium]
MRCPHHGVVVGQVPWARHGAGHTYAFNETCARLVTQCSREAVCELLRVAWSTVGAIVARVGEAARVRGPVVRPEAHRDR